VDACTAELEPYSRYLGRNPEKREALEGVLQLPVMLWPESSRKALDILKAQVAQGMVVMTFNDLAAAFKSTGDLTREKVQGLASALESVHVCIEPDILAGAKSPKPEDNVILFHCEPTSTELRTTAAYKVALVTVELAAGVAAADGDFSALEVRYLNDNIESWVHLSPSTQARLKAHVQLLKLAPISLTSLKKKIEPLNSEAREAIASFSATLAQADGVVSPEEVKFLEKIYKLLGVDQKKVFSDIHVATTSENSKTVSTSANGTGIKLDTARIAALQQDTEKLSALLTNIFNEDEYRAPPPQQDEEKIENKILNLDEAHTAFARMLISRPSWLRSELSDVALDLDVMLDGALERVNEAALDAHDITFTEGDDPIEINPELLEKINS
jgi:tellurite resistance protein